MIGRSGYRNLMEEKTNNINFNILYVTAECNDFIIYNKCWCTSNTPSNIDEKCQKGEKSCRQTDDGDDADEVSDEGQLLLVEEHRGAGGRAVLPAHETVTQIWLNLELSGAPETVVPLDSHGRLVSGLRARKQIFWTRIGLITFWEPRESSCQIIQLCPNPVLVTEMGWRNIKLSAYLHLYTFEYTPVTVHVVWPGYSKYLHEFVALNLSPLADWSTWHRHLAIDGAHRSVQGTQEHPQVSAAH